MKKYIIIILAALSLSACTDNLNITPTTSVSDAAVWSDEALIMAYHTEMYNCLQNGFRSYNAFLAKATDEVMPVNVSWSGPIAPHVGNLSPDNIPGALNYWDTGYQYLRKINVFLDRIETVTVDLPNKKQLIAEAKFLKAWIYYVLTTRYGSCVLMDEYWELGDADGKTFSRSTTDECFAEIEKLVNEAMPDLPETYYTNDSNFGRATQDACLALMSRVTLYAASPLYNQTNDRSKWEKAAAASERFIKETEGVYELYPDYYECFKLDSGVLNKEYIFGRNFTKTNGHEFDHDNLNQRYGSNGGWWGSAGPTQNLVDDYEMQETGLPPFTWVNGEKTLTPGSGYDPQNPYAGRDPRFDASIIHDETIFRGNVHEMWVSEDGETYGRDSNNWSGDNPRSHYVMKKFMPDDINRAMPPSDKYTIPWPFFRLAEMYLNYAEAKFELGDEATCREYMNKVRARAGMPEVPASITGEELRTKLYNERRVELVFEEHRYFDLRRWKIAMEVENRDLYGIQIIKDATGHKTYTPVMLWGKGNKFTEQMYLLPIATDEIKKNAPDLQQTWTWL